MRYVFEISGNQAIHRHGLFLGTALGAERLLRNHRDGSLYRPLVSDEMLLFADPLSDNIFWQSGEADR